MASQPTWKAFERVVAAIHHAASQGAKVKWNDTIQGRQFDVTIRFKYGLHEYLTVVECKDWNQNIPAEKVDALVTKCNDINANKVIMVAKKGYQESCHSIARRHGIQLLTLDETFEWDPKQLAGRFLPLLNICEVFLELDKGGEYEFEDEGGRLYYLMNRVGLTFGGRTITPIQLVTKWQLGRPDINPATTVSVRLPLPQGTLADIPYEKPISVKAFRFNCKIVQGFSYEGPAVEPYIREGMARKLVLADESGGLNHQVGYLDIPLGFDTVLEPGKFYINPNFHNAYYCKSIDDKLVSWILVESYQHGTLLQVEFTQDIKESKYYVEVTDKRRLKRLARMLQALQKTAGR